MESRLLKKYEKKIASKAVFWGVTEKDVLTYQKELGCKDIDYLPLYLPDWTVSGEAGMGSYCLYHGDLSVEANEKAAIWLLDKVFSKIEVPLVIAGKNPSPLLEKMAHAFNHTCLVANPSDKEMQDMIARAHINVIPSYITTGIKIKLLNALFNGKHCVVNDATVTGSGLEALCHISNQANGFRDLIEQLFSQPFTTEEITQRKQLLPYIFNNTANAKKQIGWIWGQDAR